MMGLLWEIFTTFIKLGTIAYGGGPAMIPVIQAEVVEGKEWADSDDFGTAVGIGYSLPGPIAPKMAFWAGWQAAGMVGGLVAMIGVLLPNVALMALLTTVFWGSLGDNRILEGAAKGARIGVIGLLAYVTYNQAFKTFVTGDNTNWLQGFAAHPDWVILVVVIFALALWRPAIMVPLGVVAAAIYGAIFLR